MGPWLFYQLLIEPMESQLKDKTELLIVPTGLLGFLPFETLVDADGKYLIEKYHIRYIQSLGVLKLLEQRIYSTTRKPMLAFGGAVYNPMTYQSDMVENETQLAVLKKNVTSTIARGEPLGSSYNQLGFGQWNNLPGTLSEVQGLKTIVPEAELKTAIQVTETGVKELSEKGELKNYKVLHFAVHGVVVPAIPELSAVVLSQVEKYNQTDDGYLTMKEIEKLKLNADFVNLSACETGLGKLYEGEGVVGLTQAFLIAGANGLSVSLWEVSDESTSLLMQKVYELVEKEKIGYSLAISKVKRMFIQGHFGEKYQNPYYWAPFVYYGQ